MNAFSGGKCNVPSIVPCRLAVAVAVVAAAVRVKSGTGLRCPRPVWTMGRRGYWIFQNPE